MVRPKRAEGEPSASERLENTFFEMLREMPYTEITIKALSGRTNVNHNTFYYYFDNIDDLVSGVIEKTLSSDMPTYVFDSFTGNASGLEKIIERDDFRKRFERLGLLIGKNSTNKIINHLKSSMLNIWLTSLGMDEAQLSEEQYTLFVFWLGGVFSVWDTYGQQDSPEHFMAMMDNEITAVFVNAINQLKDEIASK